MSDLLALLSAFIAGLASSVGPCIAPRYLMLAGYMTKDRESGRAWLFLSGCLCGYLIYASAGALIALLRVGTHVIYGLLAFGLIISGVRTLVATPKHPCALKPPPSLSRGAVFLSGLVSSAALSPCCTPIAIALGLQAAQHGGALAAALLLAFGLGHTLPLSIFTLLSSLRVLRKLSLPHDACATVSGSLLMMVGGLYGLLA